MKLPKWLVAGGVMLASFVALGIASQIRAGVTAATVYRVDPIHSTLVFRVKHMNVNYFQGRFDEVTGTLAFDDKNPAQSAIDLKVSTGSIDTASPKRDNHLKSPDFFNARQFPTITFKSKSVKKAGDDAYEAEGDLTLHGVTRTVTIPVQRTGVAAGPRGTRAGFEAIFTIKRSDFGMKNMLEMLGDEVRITANLEVMGS